MTDNERDDAEQHISRELLGVGFFYDYDGEPIGVDEYERLYLNPERTVEQTMIGARIVSTVWVGNDPMHMILTRTHPAGLALPPPLIYQTMVFPEHEELGRYPTREAARKGHEEAVTLVRARMS